MRENIKIYLLHVIQIEDVISRYLPLSKAGSGGKTLTGLCPFHDDHHPSLHVNTRDGYYKCFACGAGGDAFKFVQEMEKCSFTEALKKLAGWYGLTDDCSVPVIRIPKPRASVQKTVAMPVASVDRIQYLLRDNRMIQDCLAGYTHPNPLLADTYRSFGIGTAPDSLPQSFRFLQGRLVFPVHNERGELVAFSGRYQGDAKKDGVAKYVNSPETAVYHKRETLYGLYQSEEAITRHGFAYITEGYKDVLAMHAAGFTNTVALCGTAFTDEQALLLGKYTKQAVVMLDGDAAGRSASDKTALKLKEHGFTVGQVFLHPEQDPDSLLASLPENDFRHYIHEVTRYSRLEAYERSLAVKEYGLLKQLPLVFTVEERISLLSDIMKVRSRLGKVTDKLEHAAVMADIGVFIK
ncbi:DNA primase [Parabacteroides bouchesdurhonensis]|uniref:DNA primase n=1 Tax=Parabacteroides bouchesdurhonensis TaxID=1936995 RepID=UPI000E533225|nr:CHC2 zinc finger domain-containing protein [Parabacteroides bouchesdurhonensis]RHJ94917.1 toprim domain-containing protein [Bacteroides sp. AM07-16]